MKSPLCTVGKVLWRRKWQPTPVFLPRESHGQRSLAGYSPWGCKKSDTTANVGDIRDMGSVFPWGQEYPLEEEMATHSSIFVWKMLWTEEAGGLWSIASQIVGHD